MEIICPSCHSNIPLDEAIMGSYRNEITLEVESHLSKEKRKFEEEKKNHELELARRLDEEKRVLSEQYKSEFESKYIEYEQENKKLISELDKQKEELENRMEKEKQIILEKEREKINDEYQFKLKDVESQLKEKKEKIDKYQEEELVYLQEKRKFEEEKKNHELELARRLDEEKRVLSEQYKSEFESKYIESKQENELLKKQITELKRVSEQGSQQLQGEAYEVELENRLKNIFVHDVIKPISTGVRGADILETVITPMGRICGSILIESKNTKNWADGWIPKLKDNVRDSKSDIGVIVTTSLPKNINYFDNIEGIVVIHWSVALPVISILRNQLIEVERVKVYNENTTEKKVLLYNFLISNDFKNIMQSLVESYYTLHDDLQKEKRSIQRAWAKREKQLESGIMGLANLYGTMQGIVGSDSLPEIESLSLIEDDSSD